MISYTQLIDAINNVNRHWKGFALGTHEKQLTMSLQVYKDRGEFDCTIESAIECLSLAGYEFDSHCNNILGMVNSFDEQK